jgi:hypothetical protein
VGVASGILGSLEERTRDRKRLRTIREISKIEIKLGRTLDG